MQLGAIIGKSRQGKAAALDFPCQWCIIVCSLTTTQGDPMSQKKSKATRRSISILKQIVTGVLPGRKIAEFAANEKIKAREFSYDAQIYLLMLGQLLHLFSLNELVDISQIYASELSRIRGIVPAKLNTFSNANRTRNPAVIERFFWYVYEMLKKDNPDFVQCPCNLDSRNA